MRTDCLVFLMSTRAWQAFFTSDIGLAYGFGGGVDIKISDKLSVRGGQVDYINIRSSGVGTHNLRMSFGVVAGW